MKYVILTIVLFLFIGCNSNANQSTSSNQPSSNTIQPVAETKSDLTATQVIEAFKKANFPVKNVIVFTEENDKNKLLNRPNQYIEKISWKDSRIEGDTIDNTNSTIEIFKNEEDLNNRKNYVEAVNKKVSALAQYSYVHKNVLLRIHHDLLPKQAEEYEKILKSL